MKTFRLQSLLPALVIAGFFFALAVLTSACGQQKPQPKKPSLTITTTPADASVFLLEKERGKTPFQCRLFPDTYIIRLEKKDYQTERIKVIVKPETDSKIEVALKPVTSSVLLTSVPAAAPVLFQGKKIGETPLVIKDLPAGSYSAELDKNGYSRRTVSWKIENERPLLIKTDLASNVGTLKITTKPEGASVTVDGTVMGNTPFTERLEEGKRKIRIEKSGYVPVDQLVTITRKQQTFLKDIALEIVPSTLKISSAPEGARVFVNGKQYADTPTELKQLLPGLYKIRLEKKGYDPATRDVTITPGNTFEVALNLDSNTGGIDLVTLPPHITIYLDGKMVGTTEPDSANPGISKVLSLRNLSMGKHIITAAHKRARPASKRYQVEIRKGEVKRIPNINLWIPNIRLTMKSGAVHVGRLAATLPESILFEPEPGVKQSYKKEAIAGMESLKPTE